MVKLVRYTDIIRTIPKPLDGGRWLHPTGYAAPFLLRLVVVMAQRYAGVPVSDSGVSMRSLSLSRTSMPSIRTRIESSMLHVATLAVMLILVLTAQQYLAPQANGPLALVAIFAPYLTNGGMIMLLPFARHPRAHVLRWLLLVVVVVAVIRFAIPLIVFGGAATSNLTATSWNLYLNNVDTEHINC